MIPDQLKFLERLARIEEKQDSAKEQLKELDEKLFGNGQPGILAELGGRVTRLERLCWITIGGSGVVLFIVKALW